MNRVILRIVPAFLQVPLHPDHFRLVRFQLLGFVVELQRLLDDLLFFPFFELFLDLPDLSFRIGGFEARLRFHHRFPDLVRRDISSLCGFHGTSGSG